MAIRAAIKRILDRIEQYDIDPETIDWVTLFEGLRDFETVDDFLRYMEGRVYEGGAYIPTDYSDEAIDEYLKEHIYYAEEQIKDIIEQFYESDPGLIKRIKEFLSELDEDSEDVAKLKEDIEKLKNKVKKEKELRNEYEDKIKEYSEKIKEYEEKLESLTKQLRRMEEESKRRAEIVKETHVQKPAETKETVHRPKTITEPGLNVSLEMVDGNYLVKFLDGDILVGHATGNLVIMGIRSLYVKTINIHDPDRYMRSAIRALIEVARKIGVSRLAIWMRKLDYRPLLKEEGFVESEADHRIFIYNIKPVVEETPVKPVKPHVPETSEKYRDRRADVRSLAIKNKILGELGDFGKELDINVKIDGSYLIIEARVLNEYLDRWEADEWTMSGKLQEGERLVREFVEHAETLRGVHREQEVGGKEITSRILSKWEELYSIISGKVEREAPVSHENLIKLYEEGKIINNPYQTSVVEIVVPREYEKDVERIIESHKLDVTAPDIMAQEPSLEILTGETSFQFFLEDPSRFDSSGYDIVGIIRTLINEEIPYVVTTSRSITAKFKI